MLLVLTFLLAISHVKDLTLDRALDCQMSYDGERGNGAGKLDRAERNDLTVNMPEEDKN